MLDAAIWNNDLNYMVLWGVLVHSSCTTHRPPPATARNSIRATMRKGSDTVRRAQLTYLSWLVFCFCLSLSWCYFVCVSSVVKRVTWAADGRVEAGAKTGWPVRSFDTAVVASSCEYTSSTPCAQDHGQSYKGLSSLKRLLEYSHPQSAFARVCFRLP
jgi:hypothetical protein